jgi:chemotaxis protein histidine kinase CheA
MPRKHDGEAGFERELIRRFYSARSYFFLCLSEHLGEELPPEGPGSEEAYGLVAALLDRLQASDDPRAELESLAEIPEIREYNEALDRQVQLLESKPMAAEELKPAIEGLAVHFLRAILSALRSPKGRDLLLRYLGVLEGPPAALAEGKRGGSQVRFAETDFLEEHFRRIVNEQLAQTRDDGTRPATGKLEPLYRAFAALREAAMIHGDEEIEALSFKMAELLRRASASRVPKGHVLRLAQRTIAMVKQLSGRGARSGEDLRALLTDLQAALQGDFRSAERQPHRGSPQPLREVEPSPPAPEVQTVATSPLPEEEPAESSDIGRSPEPSLVAGDAEASMAEGREVDLTAFIGIEELLDLDEASPDSTTVGEVEALAAGLQDEGDHVPAAASEVEPPPFKLPGEDDEELRALIQEVRAHSWKAARQAEPDYSWERLESEEPRSAVRAPKTPAQSKRSAPYGEFQADASLYLGVMESALALLQADPSSETALEDLEEATQRMKEILRRLGDNRLWTLASALGGAVGRARRQAGMVDRSLLRAAEAATRLLSVGPAQPLDGELDAIVSELVRWQAIAKTRDCADPWSSPERSTVAQDVAPEGRPQFRLRSRLAPGEMDDGTGQVV